MPLLPPQVILNQIDKTLVMAATSQASAERISTLQDAFCGMLSTAITKLLSQEDSKGALLPLADKVGARSPLPSLPSLLLLSASDDQAGGGLQHGRTLLHATSTIHARVRC